MYLALVHLRTLDCRECQESLAPEGSRSIIVDGAGDPVAFLTDEPPEELVLLLTCSLGHELEVNVPLNMAVENVEMTPDDAPLASDARLLE